MRFVTLMVGFIIFFCCANSAKSNVIIEIGKKQPCGYSSTGCQDTTGWNGNYVMAGDIMVGTCKVTYLIEYYEKFCTSPDPFLQTYSCQIVGLYILSKTMCKLSWEEIYGIIYLRIWNNVFLNSNVENIVCNVNMAGCLTKVDSIEDTYLSRGDMTEMVARSSASAGVLDSLFKDGPVQIYSAIVACESTRECCVSNYKVEYSKDMKKVIHAEKVGQSYPNDSNACDSAKSRIGSCVDGCKYSDLKFNYALMRGSELTSVSGQALAYPNPSDGVVRFYIPNAPQGNAEFTITNALGITVRRETISIDRNELIKEIDLSGVTPGVYLYSFKFDEKFYNGTITINR